MEAEAHNILITVHFERSGTVYCCILPIDYICKIFMKIIHTCGNAYTLCLEKKKNNNKCIVDFTFKNKNIYIMLHIVIQNIRPNSFIV